MGYKSKSDTGKKQDKVSQANQAESKTSSESGVTTPLTSDLSDSGFNYEVERNWSVIFTDDNWSTDHDIRSNYSSSSEGDEIGGAHSVISETESEQATPSTIAPSNTRRDTVTTLKAVQEEVNDSVTTLKQSSSSMEGSFSFPDPLKNENIKIKEEKKSKSTRVDKAPFPTDRYTNLLPKNSIVYGLMLLLSLDILVQLLNGSSFMGNIGTTISAGLNNDEESFNPLTIIRYATKTETLYLPGETITVETTIPHETVISDDDNVEDERESYWVLIGGLFSNFKDDAVEISNKVSERSVELFKLSSKNAYIIANQAKQHNYAEQFNKVQYNFKSTISKLLNRTENLKVDDVLNTVSSTVTKVSDPASYENVKDSLSSAFDYLWKSSKDSFDKLEEKGVFDYFKKEKRTEIYHHVDLALKSANSAINTSTNKTWNFLQHRYEDFVKPEGSLDQIKAQIKSNNEKLSDTLKRSSDKAYSSLQNGLVKNSVEFYHRVANDEDKFGEYSKKKAAEVLGNFKSFVKDSETFGSKFVKENDLEEKLKVPELKSLWSKISSEGRASFQRIF